ncbi:putative g2-specific serine threonine protein kinase protein [Daldinia childiae]|uniref:putative g2-specific serine threonine protein kinase protein n=1 Tax=Daldinia childiae TaxID=326645 RepID=UPI00144708BE|nr:putative g2-specific serine threonine protein kinase protein [Daldinia childiae]KAF3060889.1 putative g2-specific serine threonine protein kinase protein [Daldinia childiae]
MEFTSPYDDYQRALDYDFHTELAPGIWAICKKLDRTALLAHDITDMLATTDFEPDLYDDTDSDSDSNSTLKNGVGFLLGPDGANLLQEVKAIINHENLICLRDWFSIAMQKPKSRDYEKRTFIVWDNCDAGTLENLLVEEYEKYKPDQEADDSTSEDDDVEDEASDTDAKMADVDVDAHKTKKLKKFLPESLCWHVLTSVLKALAWLHDGSPELIRIGPNKYGMDPTPDWNPALHRDITPANIQFQQPRRKETYGQCKLGNYSSIYLSSHHNGDGKSSVERIRGKALVPRKGGVNASLDALIQRDNQYGYTYKEQPDQPYTVISEWRAFGEILLGMMIPPSGTKTNVNDHIENVTKHGVRYNLEGVDYSVGLKNVIIRMMTLNPDEKSADGTYLFPNRDTLTSHLCVEAFERFRRWRISTDEGQELVTVEAQRTQQASEDAIAKNEIWNATVEMNRIVDKLQMEKGPWRFDDHEDTELEELQVPAFTHQDLANDDDERPYPLSDIPPDDNWDFDP